MLALGKRSGLTAFKKDGVSPKAQEGQPGPRASGGGCLLAKATLSRGCKAPALSVRNT